MLFMDNFSVETNNNYESINSGTASNVQKTGNFSGGNIVKK